MTHRLVICTKGAKRLEVFNLNLLPGENFVDVGNAVASNWLYQNDKTIAQSHAALGDLTIWVN
jgi:hypothetical protein